MWHHPRSDAWLLAVALDTVSVLVFTTIGRASHHESGGPAGIWHTAWPFLLGTALAWALTSITRVPPTALRAGLRVWLWTVGIGMVVRTATGAGVAPAFVAVAAVFLGLFLVGWRVLLLWRSWRGWRSQLSRRLRRTAA